MAKRRSFGKKKEETNKQIFVGRTEQLRLFAENLKLGPDDADFTNIFNVYGQGGTGKTTLIHRYQKAAKAINYWVGFIDTEDQRLYNVTATMHNIAEDFKVQGAEFKRFAKRFKDYLQKKGELDADPSRPKGGFGRLLETAIKTGANVGADFIPGGNSLKEYLPVDVIANAAGEYTNYLFQKLGNKDDVELLLHPIKVLTPLWLEDLYDVANKGNGILFFDTYEAANPELDQWLYELINAKYGDFPDNFILCLSGRDALDPAHWNTLREHTIKIPLEPFTEEEAKKYLKQRGITNPLEIENILSISGKLPVYLSMLAENDPTSPDKISDPNEKVVERFLKYIKDPVQKKLALQAALPRKLNKDIVSQLVPSDADVTSLFDWLKSRPFVQKRGGYWAYHSVVKKIMVQYQNDISQVEWETTHLTLANWYGNRVTRLQTEGDRITWIKDGEWRLVLVEQYFHLLSTNYKVHIADFMQDVVLLFLYQQWVDIIPFAVSLVEVEKTMKINEWGELLYKCVASLIAGKQVGALDFFKKLNATTWIKERIFQSTLYCLQGIYEKDKINQLNCYAKAIESNPKNADAYFSQGTVLESLNREEDALESYNKAIEFNPQFVMAYNNRGIVLDKLERKEEALKSYDKAIELNSNDAKVYNNRGNVLNKLRRKEEALESYDKAIQLNPEYATPYYNRGNVLSSLGHEEEALKDYDKCVIK